eukprot:m.980811 g.980811  ORF g.980811 m.980811 type:complete len:531 (-) comp23969_c0_seq28:513-2105(-)
MEAVPPSDWRFVGAGGSSVVVSHPKISGFVLRLKRIDGVVTPSQYQHFLVDEILPLLGPTLVETGHVVPLTKCFLQCVEQSVATQMTPLEKKTHGDSGVHRKKHLIDGRQPLPESPRASESTLGTTILDIQCLEGLLLIDRRFSICKNTLSWKCAAGYIDSLTSSTTKGGPREESSVAHHHQAFQPCGSLRHTPVCVEIKPKCGFLSVAAETFISGDRTSGLHGRTLTVSRGTNADDCCPRIVTDEAHGDDHTPPVLPQCRHCLHQTLKVASGKWPCPSAYCPLDLFARSHERIMRALQALRRTPQNNLRVFVGESTLITTRAPDKYREQEATDNLLRNALGMDTSTARTEHVAGAEGSVHGADPWDTLFEIIADCLLKHSVLPSIESIQRMGSASGKDIVESLNRILSIYLPAANQRLAGDRVRAVEDVIWHTDPLCAQDARELRDIRNFLLSMAAKDCSIMLTIAPRIDDPRRAFPVHYSTGGQPYTVDVAVVDLDVKSALKIPGYVATDEMLGKLYANTASMAGVTQ